MSFGPLFQRLNIHVETTAPGNLFHILNINQRPSAVVSCYRLAIVLESFLPQQSLSCWKQWQERNRAVCWFDCRNVDLCVIGIQFRSRFVEQIQKSDFRHSRKYWPWFLTKLFSYDYSVHFLLQTVQFYSSLYYLVSTRYCFLESDLQLIEITYTNRNEFNIFF